MQITIADFSKKDFERLQINTSNYLFETMLELDSTAAYLTQLYNLACLTHGKESKDAGRFVRKLCAVQEAANVIKEFWGYEQAIGQK